MRSKIPNLIFQDVLEKRAEKIFKLLDDKESLGNIKLDRVTLFITHRCNLHCKYCKGPHMNKDIPVQTRIKMLTSDFPLPLYKKLLKQWVKHGLKYMHFTGGEPTLHPQLPEFIKLAKQNGILTSITTNGTTSVGLLRKLVELGLYEIRISIDTFNPLYYESVTGVKGSYAAVKRTIKELIKMRDEEGKDIFIIINSISSEYNWDDVKNEIKELVELKPDDIEILLDPESKEKIYPEGRRQIINDLLDYLKNKNIEMEVLKDKILHFFRKKSVGLNDDESKHVMKKCYLPLTERTIDANGIYPCPIYLKNYGNPIANPNEPFDKQQNDIVKWVNSGSCPFENICQKNCAHSIKRFNLYMNKKVREIKTTKELSHIAIKVDKIQERKRETVYKIMRKIRKIKLNKLHPYMVIKPEAQRYKNEILSYIKSQIYGEIKVIEIKNWNEVAFFIYAKLNELNENIKYDDLRFAISNAHSKLSDGHATLLILPEEVPLQKLKRIKWDVRNWYGLKALKVIMPDNDKAIRITENYVHSPDMEKLFYELQVLKYFKLLSNSSF